MIAVAAPIVDRFIVLPQIIDCSMRQRGKPIAVDATPPFLR
jgi:hypothetical protein